MQFGNHDGKGEVPYGECQLSMPVCESEQMLNKKQAKQKTNKRPNTSR